MRADDGDEVDQGDGFVVPPPPEAHPPRLSGEVRLAVVFPFEQDPLCPDGSACVFGGGGGVGGLLEWRYPSGLALGAGLDVWFLDGNGVHELSTMLAARFQLRWFLLPQRQIHPYVGASVGGLLFGDTFKADAVGGLVDALAGFEVEIGPNLAITVGLGVRVFTTTSFESRSDMVERGQGGVDAAATLQAGVVLLQGT